MIDPLFAQALGYTFRNEGLLENALTHSSFINEAHGQYEENNERLEFLGDAVFDLLISEYLYERFAHVEEGSLTRMRAAIVCEGSLAQCGQALDVGRALRLGRGEEMTGGRERVSVVADSMEAIIGAIYLDGGIEAARTFVLERFRSIIEEAMEGKRFRDYKTEIQEKLQAGGRAEIAYMVEREEGPDHEKVFFVALRADGRIIGRGSGRSKKEAEQNAARAALEDKL